MASSLNSRCEHAPSEGAPARQLDLDERLAVARLLVVLGRPADDVHDYVLLLLEAADQRLRVDAVSRKRKASYSSVMTRRRIFAKV